MLLIFYKRKKMKLKWIFRTLSWNNCSQWGLVDISLSVTWLELIRSIMDKWILEIIHKHFNNSYFLNCKINQQKTKLLTNSKMKKSLKKWQIRWLKHLIKFSMRLQSINKSWKYLKMWVQKISKIWQITDWTLKILIV